MSKGKRTAKPRGPLTIAVHGPGVAIDATFDDAAHIGEVCDELSRRWSQGATADAPPPTTGQHDSPSVQMVEFVELVARVCPELHDNALTAALDVLLKERARRTDQGAKES